MIELLSKTGEKIPFKLTHFPDGTSQAWQVENLDRVTIILWRFEEESELINIFQLINLIGYTRLNCTFKGVNTFFPKAVYFYNPPIHLVIPYLPYARQDKEIDNNKTFALRTLLCLFREFLITSIWTYDIHSLTEEINSLYPTKFHETVHNLHPTSLICYPDKGAYERYKNSFPNHQSFYFEKLRNQQTGEIINYTIAGINENDLYSNDILIVDDICDGGNTFIKATEYLRCKSVGNIDLAVSHGLFTKGRDILYNAGIRQIHTTNSVLENEEGPYDIDIIEELLTSIKDENS
jgi:ribose-phosphate pyrophosphokinase